MKIKSITKIKILLVVLVAMIAGFYLYRYISSNSQRSKATENTDVTVNFGDIFRTADHKAVVPTSNIVKDKEYILSFDVLLKNPVQYRISGISFRFRYNPTNITFLPDYTFSEQLDTKVIVDSLRDVDGSGDKIARIVLVNKNSNSVNLPSTVRVMIAFIAKGSGQTKVEFIGSGLRSDLSSIVGVQVSANPVVPYTFALPSESKLFTIVDSTSSSSSSSSSSSTSSSSSSSSSSFVACDLRTTSIACTSIECAWYICSSSCHPRGTTNCEAGCASYCSSSSSSSSFASSSSSSSRPASSSSSRVTCEKTKGDANCDGKIDLTDYSIWLLEFKGKCGVGAVINADRCQDDGEVPGYKDGILMDADFNNLNGVTLADYSNWYANWPGK